MARLYYIMFTFCMQGKGEMRTYWLVGEDPARRLARIRGQTISSLVGTFSFDREYCPEFLQTTLNGKCGVD
jgi:hypothetical protein